MLNILSFHLDISILPLWKCLDEYDLSVYVTNGIGVYGAC
jgi:hypothetical protein